MHDKPLGTYCAVASHASTDNRVKFTSLCIFIPDGYNTFHAWLDDKTFILHAVKF